MTSTPDPGSEIDEVERCRRTRRELERAHGDLAGLCDWIETMQQQPATKKSPPAGRKSGRVARRTARKQ